MDEYSRLPFAFALPEITTEAAIQCLTNLFLLFGPPSYVHSDRGSQFDSNKFRTFLDSWNIGKSRTTPYHPSGNGQVERCNGIIWKTVSLRLAEKNLPAKFWEDELAFALSNIRALPSRAINNSPPDALFLSFTRRSTIDEKQQLVSTKVEQYKLPNWLKERNHVYIKNHRRTHKADSLVYKVLIRKILSSHHAEVLFIDSGRISTVSTRHLSRAPTEITVKPVETFKAVEHAPPHSAGKIPAAERTIEIKDESEDPVLETKIENIVTENSSLGAINDDTLSVLNNYDEPIHNASLQENDAETI